MYSYYGADGGFFLKHVSEWSYEEMLDRALSMLPQKISRGERFKLPIPNTSIIGNRTIVYNFKEICDVLNRDIKHVLRFLLRELGTAGDVEDSRLILQGRFSSSTIFNILNRYAKLFVICPVCGAPDTYITREKRVFILVCTACGARTSVSARGF
ncbi:MAG TPA: translation initiation factor IF-2 subunit beta [Candidatus Bathyarchaeota archaeon]|nr:translation initiation factor IF-2 subunit beta [Candidatus Verstraetearchaeota archaeon]RLE52666.1 MAG: translation initiation factor IF-2 subunit beta [Candidatus Verstraetearchaeota archaeon]HDO21156.1 translation initiation factor IF-2 subunit beta [Candidatus Bathyarchaeota archaeon]